MGAPASTSLRVVEHALSKSRRKAYGGIASALFGGVVTMTLWTSPVALIGFGLMNALLLFFVGRRLVRTRKGGPVARALLEAPAEITAITQWPPKLPPKRHAVGLNVRTFSGHEAMLDLDPKDVVGATQLVAALRERSPEATVVWTAAPQPLAPP